MEPKFETKAAFTVIGYKYRGKNEQSEIPQMWGEFMKREGEVKPRPNPDTGYGVMGNFDKDSGEFDYVAGLEVDPKAETPEGMVRWDIPEAYYAVLPCTLPTLKDAFDFVCKKWMPESGYQGTNGPEFEYYPPSFDPQVPDSELLIYIPVIKKD